MILFNIAKEICLFTIITQHFLPCGLNTWTLHAYVTGDMLGGIQKIHKISQRDQFLMKLRPEFENVPSNLMSWQPSPSLETCLNDILWEERQVTQAHLTHQSSGGGL